MGAFYSRIRPVERRGRWPASRVLRWPLMAFLRRDAACGEGVGAEADVEHVGEALLGTVAARAARRRFCGGTAARRRAARRLHAGTGRAGPGRDASGGRRGVQWGGDGGALVRRPRRGAQGRGGAARARERRRAGQRAAGGAATSGARRSRGHGEARACVHATGQEQAPHGTARKRGSKLPGGSHRRRSTDNDRESARGRPSSPGSADIAVGAGARRDAGHGRPRAAGSRGFRSSGPAVEIVADTPCPSKKLAPVKDGASAGRAAHRTRGKCLDHDDRLPAQQVVTRAYLIDVSVSMEL